MAKKVFTDESLSTLVSEIKGYTDEAVSTKADSGHSHNAASTSAAGFMSKDDKTKLNGIATGAEVNQNAFSNVVVGSTTISADSKTDSLTIAAGTGISVSGDATNDKVTITNSGVRSISTGTSNGTISVNTNGSSANVAVKGLGSAAYTASTAYDAAGTAQTKADAALASAKSYTDGKIDEIDEGFTNVIMQMYGDDMENPQTIRAIATEEAAAVKNDLLNGAGSAYDTLKELGDLIDDNKDAIDVLEAVASGKADANHTHNYAGSSSAGGAATSANKVNKSLTVKLNGGTTEGTNMFTFNGSAAKSMNITASSIGAAASSHAHDDKYYTEAEIDSKVSTLNTAISGKAASSHTHNISDVTNLQSTLDGKAASGHTHTYSDVGAAPASHTHSSYANQNAFSNVTVGSTTIAADTTTDTLTLVAGSNVTITPDATNDKITIAATDTTYSAAGSSLGLVKSGGDVTISSGVITVNDDSHAHVISNVDGLQAALDAKSASGHTHSLSKLGCCNGLCETAEATVAKTVSDSDFVLTKGGVSYIKFMYAVPAGATLNINNTGAKAILHKASSAIKAGVIKANDIATLVYDGTSYHLVGIDRGATNDYSLPTASSSTLGGVKIGSNINISSGTISVPAASDTTAGVTVVYPSAKCTTYTSDSGTCTPLAVQNSAKKFAITRPSSSTNKAITRYSNTTGDVQDSKIIIEDVTNTKDSSKKAQVISIPAEGGKKMVYGYCTDQVDGTSFIGGVFDASATSYPYAQGLAIGGTSGNLLWKGAKVATTADIPSTYAGSSSAGGAANSSISDVPVTTAGTGSAYTATVAGITALTKGVSFVMVPHVVSASTSPTLNVNSLGAKSIKRRLSTLATSVQNGYNAAWLAANQPFRMTYDGTYWIAEGMNQPVAADLYGTVSVAKGGTGATTAAAALTALGAAAAGHLHDGQSINPACIELMAPSGATNGGYIDFHFGGDTGDYTSRIIEDTSGQLRVTGTLKVTSPGATTNAVRNIFANTSTPTVASAEGTIRLVYA